MNYDAQNLRLKNLQTTTAAGRLIQNNSYIYDAVGNILQLTNNADPVTEDHLYGGATTNSYTYDNRYQLITAEGSFAGNDKEHKYAMAMEYGATGNILRKTQSNQWRKNEGDWLTDATTSMDYTYSYNGQKPHAVSSIVDNNTETLFTYTYDASGNNLLETNNKASSDREIVWTEDNRLAAIKARGNVSHYVYDANGIRTLKMSSSGFNISINGVTAGTDGIDGNFTIYANPYIVVRENQCTKHFFLGSQRILTKISSSDVPQTFFEGYAENIVPNVDYESKQDDLESNLLLNNKELNIGWYRETRGRIPSQHIKHYLRSKEYGGLSGVNPWQDGTETTDKTATYEEKQYFFHPDHLGSSNYLTDVLGEAYQHIEYLPWGEIFVEERNTQTSRNTFLYTGKELDEATGLYYYEQRYYDALKSTFLGVDQLVDKYPHISGFAYVANNPLVLVDPDGRKIFVIGTKEYRDKVKKDIEQLQKDDSEVGEMIRKLCSSPHRHEIYMPGSEGYNSIEFDEVKQKKEVSQGSKIFYDPDNWETASGKVRTPRVGLAHELQHADDLDSGSFDESIKTERGIPITEVDAINTENKIRKVTGDEKRTTYQGKEISTLWLDN